MAKKFLFVVLALLMLAGLGACGNINRTPRYDVKEPLTVTPFKRVALREKQDFIYNWKKDAYAKVSEPLRQRFSASQGDVLERHGQPDYVRRSFKATTKETVEEWAYWDRDVICQFVQRELVWEGPLTDMDRTRIRYGYPRRAWSQIYESGVRRDMWDYQGMLLDIQGSIFTFSDEKLVYANRYQ